MPNNWHWGTTMVLRIHTQTNGDHTINPKSRKIERKLQNTQYRTQALQRAHSILSKSNVGVIERNLWLPCRRDTGAIIRAVK